MATPNDLDPRAVMRNRSLAQALSTGIDQANLVLLGSALASADTFAARLEQQRSRRRRQSMGLTLEEANRILRGTLAKAQELNIKISAAICDPGGRPIALQRMDNTMWASAYAAQGTTSSNPPSSRGESMRTNFRGAAHSWQGL